MSDVHSCQCISLSNLPTPNDNVSHLTKVRTFWEAGGRPKQAVLWDNLRLIGEMNTHVEPHTHTSQDRAAQCSNVVK